ncbi:hypothetical protein TIFTF001_040824 [Ficus carica]|uniref:Uncharacterized protein n=1 Tax=Ficus carica TaxID=3494 RepID=A0AA87Z0P6_FICCA|nr:hypothetical protein TIFTF001_040824 [Ficus carica]
MEVCQCSIDDNGGELPAFHRQQWWRTKSEAGPMAPTADGNEDGEPRLVRGYLRRRVGVRDLLACDDAGVAIGDGLLPPQGQV